MRRRDDDEQVRRVGRRRLLAEVGLALLPAVTLVVVTALGPEGAEGRWRGALAGLVVITSVGAFATGSGGPRAPRRALVRVASAALVAGLVFGVRDVIAGAEGGAFDILVLYLGVGTGACGLATLGRAMRTPSVAAGAVAACVLWTAMAGLFWADPVATHVDRTQRRSLRQAVLHVDPSLALAYGAVGYDRMRSEDVYFGVPLASSFYDRPAAGSTGLAWLVTGLVAWGTALLVGIGSARRASRAGSEAGGDAVATIGRGAGILPAVDPRAPDPPTGTRTDVLGDSLGNSPGDAPGDAEADPRADRSARGRDDASHGSGPSDGGDGDAAVRP